VGVRSHAIALSVLAFAWCVPRTALAQPAYEETFETWDPACVAALGCGSTGLREMPAGGGVSIRTDCARPGQCVGIHFEGDDRRLIPFRMPWAPSPSELAVSFWVDFEPGFLDNEGSYAELVRGYCEPAPCNLLLELFHPADAPGPILYWQRETTENVGIGRVCVLPVDVTPGWHRIYAHVRMNDASTSGACELQWDATGSGSVGLDLRDSPEGFPTFTSVELGGNGISYGVDASLWNIGLDDVCIDTSAAGVDCNYTGPAPDAGVAPPVDGGTTAPPPAPSPLGPPFRGGGGCTCAVGARSVPPAAAVAGLALALLALWRARRARERA